MRKCLFIFLSIGIICLSESGLSESHPQGLRPRNSETAERIESPSYWSEPRRTQSIYNELGLQWPAASAQVHSVRKIRDVSYKVEQIWFFSQSKALRAYSFFVEFGAMDQVEGLSDDFSDSNAKINEKKYRNSFRSMEIFDSQGKIIHRESTLSLGDWQDTVVKEYSHKYTESEFEPLMWEWAKRLNQEDLLKSWQEFSNLEIASFQYEEFDEFSNWTQRTCFPSEGDPFEEKRFIGYFFQPKETK